MCFQSLTEYTTVLLKNYLFMEIYSVFYIRQEILVINCRHLVNFMYIKYNMDIYANFVFRSKTHCLGYH